MKLNNGKWVHLPLESLIPIQKSLKFAMKLSEKTNLKRKRTLHHCLSIIHFILNSLMRISTKRLLSNIAAKNMGRNNTLWLSNKYSQKNFPILMSINAPKNLEFKTKNIPSASLWKKSIKPLLPRWYSMH